MDADVRLDGDDSINRPHESGDHILLALGETTRRASAMTFAGSEMAIGKMADFHRDEYTPDDAGFKSQSSVVSAV